MGGAVQLQGLWRSASRAELSLATSPGGVVVGIYQIQGLRGLRRHAVSGHFVASCLALSSPFPDRQLIATWSGGIVQGVEGPALRLTRRLVGDSLGGDQAAVVEVFERASESDTKAPLLPVQSLLEGRASLRR